MLREWYMEAFPSDELGEFLNEISFEDLWKFMYRGQDVHKIIGVGDSLLRERVFMEMSERFDTDYEDIYTMWLNN